MEYLHVLSRPMVINHDHDIIWTEAYMDSVVSVPRLLSRCLPGNTSSLLLVICHQCMIMKMSDRLVRLEMLLMVHIISVIFSMEGNIQLTLCKKIHPLTFASLHGAETFYTVSSIWSRQQHQHNRLVLQPAAATSWTMPSGLNYNNALQ